MTTYKNCAPGDQLNVPFPRAVYRVILARTPYVGDFLTSLRIFDWSTIVKNFEDALTSTGLVFELGTATVSDANTVGVVDMRVSYAPGTATVANLVSKLEDLASFADIVSIERFEEVPGFSEGGPDALNRGKTDTQIAAQHTDDATRKPVIPRIFAGIENILIAALVIGGVILYLKSE